MKTVISSGLKQNPTKILNQHYNSISRISNQIDNLTVHLKQLEIEEQKPPKLVEGKKSLSSEQK